MAVEVTETSTAHWYVIQCKGSESFRAAEHLSNQGYEVFHPVLDVKRKRQGKLTTVTEPYGSVNDMEGYVPLIEHQVAFSFFIELRRQAYRSDNGVTGLLPSSAFPACVYDSFDHV